MTNVIHPTEYSWTKFERRLQKAHFLSTRTARPLYVRDKYNIVRLLLLALLLLPPRITYSGERKAKAIYLSDPSLEFVHRHQLAKGADYYIRTSCSVLDYNIRFYGGCGWILAWEENIGRRLGRGIRFIKEEEAKGNSLNFFFARQPVEKIVEKSVIKTRQNLALGCSYIVYEIGGGDFHAAFLDENKDRYNECIAKSIVNYLYYSGRSMIKNGSYFDDLMRLYVALSGTGSLKDDVSSAKIVVGRIIP